MEHTITEGGTLFVIYRKFYVPRKCCVYIKMKIFEVELVHKYLYHVHLLKSLDSKSSK